MTRHERVQRFIKHKAVMRSIYVIGSLRNPRIPEIAKTLRETGWDAFDDWYSSGPETDDYWQRYEKDRKRSFAAALGGHHARNVFEHDLKHLQRCDVAMLVAPAGKSAHLELGFMIGQGKPSFILLDGEPERFDVMYNFAKAVFTSLDEALEHLTEVLR